MKLWIDDVQPAPEGYVWCKNINEAKHRIRRSYEEIIANSTNKTLVDYYSIEIIDINHDTGEFACDGGDYIKLLDWLEVTGRNIPIRIHSARQECKQLFKETTGWR